ncbi:hypothetical protein Ae201684P_021649 [Aphanomyces euteiches]|uniref:Ketoreductase (KR) domain-containing protein n=1 Tax=Aphanomyces euteiches TaxID=100861 RepID=A0A6G0X6W9_9STRA|nr:hypothetical protein Ae201684_007771 [Aphanomyces euteiches]KAH9067492.1 hypothetical protein Ae201684P_021649 [Aphanomyces euteiches]
MDSMGDCSSTRDPFMLKWMDSTLERLVVILTMKSSKSCDYNETSPSCHFQLQTSQTKPDVTGGTAGLGLQSVIELARKGCHVIFTARNPTRGQEALEKIQAALAPTSFKVEFAIADNADLPSIVRFADAFLARNLPLHILLLNAGVGFTPYRAIHGVESTLFINHVAHQLLATCQWRVLEQSAPSRGNDSTQSYSNSKLALILMAHGLVEHFGSAKVYVNSVHPGIVATDITNRPMEFAHLLQVFASTLVKLLAMVYGATPQDGALMQLYVATSPDIVQHEWHGEYFVPIAKLDKASPLSNDRSEVKQLWTWTTAVIARVLAKSKE